MQKHFALPAVAAALSLGALGPMTDCAPDGGGGTNDCAKRNSRGDDLAVVGLVGDGSLVCFQDGRPDRATTVGAISGLTGDSSLVGIDYRPATNVLYGVGNAGGIYTVDAGTAAARKVSQLNVALEGTSFGVDFNPTVDRLRIISDTGQNLRANVDDGSTTPDTPLNIPGATPVNPATGVIGAAYTNNDADPNTATTLFDIDTGANRDQTVIQSPANSGQLAATGKLTVDASGAVGFDIYATQRNGTTSSKLGPGGHPDVRRVRLLPDRAADRPGRGGRLVPGRRRRRRHPHGAELTPLASPPTVCHPRRAVGGRPVEPGTEQDDTTVTDDVVGSAEVLRTLVARAATHDPDAWEELYRPRLPAAVRVRSATSVRRSDGGGCGERDDGQGARRHRTVHLAGRRVRRLALRHRPERRPRTGASRNAAT